MKNTSNTSLLSFAGLLWLMCIPTAAFPWTQPVVISPSGDTETSIPKIARASDGRILVTWRRKFPDWRLFYRERSPNGVWGPVETVSVPWSERPDIIEDPLGRPHMFYAGTGAGGKTDLFEAVKIGGTWTITQFTNTDTIDEDYARLGTDSLGRIHLVYTKNNDVYYRVWNGSWSGETYLGRCDNAYYHRPDMSVAPDNTVHVTWQGRTTFYYRKFDGSTWLPTKVIGTTTTDNFFAYGKIAAISATRIVAVTFDQLSSAVIKWTYSTDGGTTWAPLAYLNDGHYPNMDAWNGKAHLVYQWSGGKSIGYRQWNGSAWTPAERVTPDTGWQGWPDIAADVFGNLHVVLDNESKQIYYVTSAPDTIPPQPVTGFAAAEGDGSVKLTWTNPTDPDFKATTVRMKVGSCPANPTDGTLIGDYPGEPGSAGSCVVSGLTNGVVYYFAAFAHDSVPNYSPKACVSAKPHQLTCLEAKQLSDNTWVRLTNKVITYTSATQGFTYVQDLDRAAGIRVATAGANLSVGDVVTVEGNVTTRVLSGLPSERQVSSAVVTKTGSTASVAPLCMKCSSVGGGSAGPLVPGVVGGIGTNNIGLLVRIAGRITAKLNDTIWVDDGSGVVDPSGRIGVLVKCPDTNIPVGVGSFVSVCGVVEGSIPLGWPGNRRQIRIRSYADLRVY
ncbi:MAG: hypothetical protein QHI38_05950 [Armatimonadota bacterium]|nr:hypothetical protein [Armatimonadota bacterium]